MAIIENPRMIDLDDIQGLITRGYGKMLARTYLLLKVDDPAKAKQWMEGMIPKVDSANHTIKGPDVLHLAFTASGLSALGLSDANLANFPHPFREGMDTTNRNRILGDYEDNAPTNWRWGGKGNDIHIVLIIHAANEAELKPYLAEQLETIANGGLSIVKQMSGFQRADSKEPFGFHDGISQPVIKGSGRSGPDNDIVAAGEFLMGYKNEYDLFPPSPIITEEQGDMNLLAADAAGSGHKDFGRNGSFMVYRQMQQHVDEFWNFMKKSTANPDGTENEEAKIKLASKCVGRWPSGAPLAKYPIEDPGESGVTNDYGYADDTEGLKCPFGSHMRRNNPRDTFRAYDPKQSLMISRRHRIMRRGSSYTYTPPAGDASASTTEETGLHFVCFNTSIEMQYEFIQHAWANNRQLHNLTNDIDVIIGVPPEGAPDHKTSQFTVQDEPVNQFVDNVTPFVTIRGGEYFFMPSISGLHYIASL